MRYFFDTSDTSDTCDASNTSNTANSSDTSKTSASVTQLSSFFETGTKFWTAAAELRERGGRQSIYKNAEWPKILRTPSNCWRDRGARFIFKWSIFKILKKFQDLFQQVEENEEEDEELSLNGQESEFQDLFQNVEEKEEEELSLSGHTPDPQHSSKSFNFRYRTEETNILYKPCPQMYGFLWLQDKTLLPDVQI